MKHSTSLVSRGLVAISVLAVGAAVLVSTSAPARAQGLSLELGAFAGWHQFNAKSELGRYWDTEDSAKSFLVVGPRLGVGGRWVMLETEAGFIPTTTRDRSVSTLILSWRAHLLFHPFPDATIKPFLLAGGGGISSLSSGNTSVFDRDTDGGPHLGVGVKMPLTKRIGLRLDGRGMLFPSIARGENEPDFEALASVFLRWGGDQAPPRKSEPEAAAAAPDNDPDRDGVLGDADKCPNEAEDKDEFEDADGCPDPDNDKDGVADAQDKCPLVAGTEALAGCPDGDKDGVADADDKCPKEPETDNSYQDDDGCPDKVPEKLKKFTGTIEGINFKTNSDVIDPSSFKVLDRAAAVLTEFKGAKMSVEGHTDNVGKRELNVDLSGRRAAAVKKYLVDKGVPADNLSTKGHGPDKPVASNKRPAGRAKNRRVEFVLVD